MSNGYQVEIVRRIYDNGDGRFLSVGPSGDFPENVMLYAEKSEEDYFGSVRIDLPAAFMRQIALALLAAADEAEKSTTQEF